MLETMKRGKTGNLGDKIRRWKCNIVSSYFSSFPVCFSLIFKMLFILLKRHKFLFRKMKWKNHCFIQLKALWSVTFVPYGSILITVSVHDNLDLSYTYTIREIGFIHVMVIRFHATIVNCVTWFVLTSREVAVFTDHQFRRVRRAYFPSLTNW